MSSTFTASFADSLRRASLDPLQQSADGFPVVPRLSGSWPAFAWQAVSTSFTSLCGAVGGAQRGAGGRLLKASNHLLHLYSSKTEQTALSRADAAALERCMMGESCLEMKDDAPDQTENNSRVAIDNTRGADAEQVHLKHDRERRSDQEKWLGAPVCRGVTTP